MYIDWDEFERYPLGSANTGCVPTFIPVDINYIKFDISSPVIEENLIFKNVNYTYSTLKLISANFVKSRYRSERIGNDR